MALPTLRFGPTASKDANANGIKTVPGRGYFSGVRLYSPTQSSFDKPWKPDDIVTRSINQ